MLQQVGFGVKFIKDFNELSILRYIKRYQPISRSDIARKRHLSKAAVSEIVGHLLEKGYVHQTGVGNSTMRGGRKPILLTFNPKAGFVIAVDIKHSAAQIKLLDMEANVYLSETLNYDDGYPLQNIVADMFPLIQRMLQVEWVKQARPIGIAVGIPGLIDYCSRSIKVTDNLKSWENIPVCDLFEKEFNISTILENDVKIMTLGECLFGNEENNQNIVNLYIGDGIGAGIFLNGSLVRGVSASAGEIGYIELGFYIRDSGQFPLLYRGQKRYGEILSNRWLLKAAREAVGNGHQTRLALADLSTETLVLAAERGDALAVALIDEYATILGSLCINLINTLNIEVLIISGAIVKKSDYLIRVLREKVGKDLLRLPAEVVKIRSSNLKEDGLALGAAGLVMEDLFFLDTLNLSKYRSIFRHKTAEY
jgi:N-acetylglucosamine repressor